MFGNVALSLADLPAPITPAATHGPAGGSVYELYPSAVGGSSLHTPDTVPSAFTAEQHSPVLGGDGP